MGLHIVEDPDGIMVYTDRDGKRVPADVTPISASINDQKMFHYDEKSGDLKLNREMVPGGILEQIVKQIEKSPEKGTDIKLVIPFQGPVVAKGVRSVSYFTPEEAVHKDKTEKEMVGEVIGHHYRNQPRELWQRIKDYFLGH